jgi:hypothetical protein
MFKPSDAMARKGRRHPREIDVDEDSEEGSDQ